MDQLQQRVGHFIALRTGFSEGDLPTTEVILVRDLWAEIERLRADIIILQEMGKFREKVSGAVSEGSGDLAKIKANLPQSAATSQFLSIETFNPNA